MRSDGNDTKNSLLSVFSPPLLSKIVNTLIILTVWIATKKEAEKQFNKAQKEPDLYIAANA